MDKLEGFVNSRLYRIKGFVHPADAILFCRILQLQAEQGWRGGLAEIGVFYGRSFALLAHAAKQTGETAIGIDLFDIDGQRQYVDTVLSEEKLSEHTLLRPMSSADIKPSDVRSAVGPVRFFSVDGGHELHHLENDTVLAQQSLADHGVIAFDDFMNAQYPDLSVAVLDFLRRNSETLAPFAISKTKLYVCNISHYDFYRKAAGNFLLGGGITQEDVTLLNWQVNFFNQPIASRFVFQKLARFGMGNVASRLTPNRKREFSR